LEEKNVIERTILLIGLGAALWLPVTAQAADNADKPTTEQEQAAAPKCLQAAVNPVTGHAVCINPRGAPVDPPPAEAFNKPCKPRGHDDDPFTVYERYSGCD
jgi:hypothetical protein